MKTLTFDNAVGNGSFRARVDADQAGDRCPECGHAITNKEMARIHANREARRRDQEDAIRQAVEADALSRGRAAGRAEAGAQVADLSVKLAEATQRADNAESNFADRVAEEAKAKVEDFQRTVQAEQARKDFEAFQEVAKWKKKATELQNAMERLNNQQRGRNAERDIARELQLRFPHDKIEIVAAGVNGADVLQHVNHCGKFVCTLLHESKFTQVWRRDYPTKTRADQIKAGSPHAVLWTQTMPPGVTDPWAAIEGVHVCELSAGIALTTILRTFEIKMSTKEGDNRNERGQQMLDFMVSGRGMELLRTIRDNSEAEARIDKTERQTHDTVWAKRAENRRKRDSLLEAIIAEIDCISNVD